MYQWGIVRMQTLQDLTQADHIVADLLYILNTAGIRTIVFYYIQEGDAGNEFFNDDQPTVLLPAVYDSWNTGDWMCLQFLVNICRVYVQNFFDIKSAGIPVSDQIYFMRFIDRSYDLIK